MGTTQQPLAGGAAADGRARLPGIEVVHDRGRQRSGPDQPNSTHAIAVAIARAESQRRAAAALIAARYAWRGYRVARLDADPSSELTLIAGERDATLGTLTLRLDGPAGLRADESYRRQLDAARAQGRCVCELGRFAVAAGARSQHVVQALFGRAYEIVLEFREITDVFIEVNPRHVAFYRKVLGFVVAAGERQCTRVLAPSVLLRVEVAAFEASLRELSGRATAFWTNRESMLAAA